MRALRTLLVLFALFMNALCSLAQDINFEDLQRAGPGLVQTKIVSGLASEGEAYMKQFTETDSSRREAASQARRSYSSGSSSSTSNSAAWTILGQEDGGGLAHWYRKKVRVQCNKGRPGEILTIHLLNSGQWQEVYGSRVSSLEASIAAGCRF